MGLNSQGLSPEEEGLLPVNAQEHLYVQVRLCAAAQLPQDTTSFVVLAWRRRRQAKWGSTAGPVH